MNTPDARTRAFLQLGGFDVLEAGDPHEALRAAESHPGPLGLAILDLGLAGDGPDRAARLTAARPEAPDFLQKPFGVVDLLARCRALLAAA
jgi:DNA-binding response OmpR family regulator